jgi:hypothetical protein
MTKGIPASGRARQKSFSVWLRPFIRETIEKKMSVEDGFKFLDKKAKEFRKDWR